MREQKPSYPQQGGGEKKTSPMDKRKKDRDYSNQETEALIKKVEIAHESAKKALNEAWDFVFSNAPNWNDFCEVTREALDEFDDFSKKTVLNRFLYEYKGDPFNRSRDYSSKRRELNSYEKECYQKSLSLYEKYKQFIEQEEALQTELRKRNASVVFLQEYKKT